MAYPSTERNEILERISFSPFLRIHDMLSSLPSLLDVFVRFIILMTTDFIRFHSFVTFRLSAKKRYDWCCNTDGFYFLGEKWIARYSLRNLVSKVRGPFTWMETNLSTLGLKLKIRQKDPSTSGPSLIILLRDWNSIRLFCRSWKRYQWISFPLDICYLNLCSSIAVWIFTPSSPFSPFSLFWSSTILEKKKNSMTS